MARSLTVTPEEEPTTSPLLTGFLLFANPLLAAGTSRCYRSDHRTRIGLAVSQSKAASALKAILFVAILAGGYIAIRHTAIGDWTTEERIREALYAIRGT